MAAEAAAISEIPFSGPLAERLAAPAGGGCRLYWLGQAGFVIEAGGYRLVIDPYLSDSLALKYRGGRFPHDRMMPAPIEPEAFGPVDLVLSTHAHTDHMDAQTLVPLLAKRPGTRLVAPAAEEAAARDRSGLQTERMILLDAGERVEAAPGLELTATAAAHETLAQDALGRRRYLGYVIGCGDITIWHSGDTVPFEGLVEAVRALKPDIALLPVNGRRAELSGNGVPGNFSLEEAVETAATVGARAMIAHHHGMFAFNTCPPERIDRAAAAEKRLAILRARTGVCYEIGPRPLGRGDGC